MEKKKATEGTINARVKILRDDLKMTQQEFADKLGLKTGNTISMLERNESTLTEQNIKLLTTPNQLSTGKTVNEEWLRHGIGEMFAECKGSIIEQILSLFDQLSDKGQDQVIDYTEMVLTKEKATRVNEKRAEKRA